MSSAAPRLSETYARTGLASRLKTQYLRWTFAPPRRVNLTYNTLLQGYCEVVLNIDEYQPDRVAARDRLKFTTPT
jgi:hypothetical protein